MNQFVTLTNDEFQNFALTHQYGSFHQDTRWAELKKMNGWLPCYVGIKNDGKLIAASLILKKKLFLNYSIMYAPRGFLIDYNDNDLLEYFINGIKALAKKENVIFVKIDPCVDHFIRDINGNIIEEQTNNSQAIKNLKQLGFNHKGLTIQMEGLQPRWYFYINLENKTEEEVLKNMEPKTRQIIRNNMRTGVTTRFIGVDELKKFTDITKHTAGRRGFLDRPHSYYENMVKTYGDDAKVALAEIDLQSYVENLDLQLKEANELIQKKTADVANNNPKVNIEKTKRAIEDAKNDVARIEKKKDRANSIIDEDGSLVVLGGILYFAHNKELLSLFGGSYDKYSDFYSFYTLNWNMIKYALENGFNKYNFYGINGDFADKTSPNYGLYDFKRGFGGQVGEYIGEFDLIINPLMNYIYEIALKIYNTAKKLKQKVK